MAYHALSMFSGADLSPATSEAPTSVRARPSAELDALRQALAEAQREIEVLRAELRARDAERSPIQHSPVQRSPIQLSPSEPAAAPVEAADAQPELSGSLQRIAVMTEEEAAASRAADRRSSERWACALELEFAEESQFFAGISQDISTGGLFLATYHRLAVGTPLQLRFELPNGTTIEARGEVRWVSDPAPGKGRPGVGVAFTQLSPAALEEIRAFCRVCPPLYVEL